MTKIREKRLNEVNSNLHTFDALLSQIQRENIEAVQSLVQVFGDNSPSNQMSCHGYFGNWKAFLAISSCIYLGKVSSDSFSTVDKEHYKEVLHGILKVFELFQLVGKFEMVRNLKFN